MPRTTTRSLRKASGEPLRELRMETTPKNFPRSKESSTLPLLILRRTPNPMVMLVVTEDQDKEELSSSGPSVCLPRRLKESPPR